jgi:hypothetical protein
MAGNEEASEMTQITETLQGAGGTRIRTSPKTSLFVALVIATLIAGAALVALNAVGALDIPGNTAPRAAADSRLDDYGLRHPAAPAINREDDYGLRHPAPFGAANSADSRLDDYGLRHPAPFGGSGSDPGE